MSSATSFSARVKAIRIFVTFLFVSSFIASVRDARAAQGTGVLAGTVSDAATGKPIPEVIVTVTSKSLQGEEIVLTDSSGFYRVPNLPPGVYAIRFDANNYLSNAQDGFTLRADIALKLNVQLAPESSKAENLIIKVRPTVDVGSSSTGTNITKEFVKRVPLAAPGGKGSAARSFESVAETAPGSSNDNYGVSISGTTSLENRYVVDGLSVSNPGFGNVGSGVSTEFVDEVNVVTGGYMPEYGRTTGGVLSVVTKSGSNEFEISAFSYVSPGALEGKRTPVPRDNSTVLYEPKLSYIADVGADIGGPIIKDKLWFYFGFDFSNTRYDVTSSLYRHLLDANGMATDDVEILPGTSNKYPADLHTTQALGKITWAVAENHRLAISLFAAPTSSGGNGKFSLEPESGNPEVGAGSDPGEYQALAHLRTARPIDTNLKWSSEFLGKKMLLDITAGWHNERDQILGADGSGPANPNSGYARRSTVTWLRGDDMTPPHGINDFLSTPIDACNPEGACPVGIYVTGGPGDLRVKDFNRYQLSSTLTYLANAAGHHVIKAGLDTEYTDFRHNKSISGGRFLEESSDGTLLERMWGYGVLTGPDQPAPLNPYPTHSKSISVGGFLQDSWSILDKVTLNAGLRYDNQLMYENSGRLGLALTNEWSPRIGVIYDPTQDGRSKVFASYARYYQTVTLDVADVTLSGDPHLRAHIDATMCNPRDEAMDTQATSACNDPTKYVANDDAGSNPNQIWSQEGGGKTAIDPNLKPPSTDELIVGGEYDLLADNRIGLTYDRRWLKNWIEDMSNDNLGSYFYGNPGYGIAAGFPKADRRYDAVTFSWTKAFSRDWLAQGSYTVSWLRGNLQGLFSKGSDLAPSHLGDFDLARIEQNRVGPLPGDNRHSVKLFTSKDWRLGQMSRIATGLAFRANSGSPTNYLGKDPAAGDGATFILPRGAGERLPWMYTADLQLGYRYAPPSSKMVLSFTVDVFNVFNFQQATDRDEIYTNNEVFAIKDGTKADLDNLKTVDDANVLKNENFGHPISFQPPRVFRFGIRGEF